VRRLGPVLTLGIALPALLGLAACSSSKKATVPPVASTTSTGATSTSSAATSTVVTTSPPAPATTVGGGPTTTIAPAVITVFTVTPSSPVACSAPTMIELKWTAKGASAVVLSIDGVKAATFTGGAQDHLQYFACDGKKHTYTLTAKVGTTTETASRVVTSKPLS
jgi:hypothetical protein